MPQQCLPSTRGLSPTHRAILHSSAITDEVIAQRGYYTETRKSELGRMGFSYPQRQVPALVIPVYGPNGVTNLVQIRPDTPRLAKGKKVKYDVPKGCRLAIDVPPCVAEKVMDATVPLYITEGIRKSDAGASAGLACIGLMGVYGWRKQEKFWHSVPLKDRVVYITFDSDIAENANVRRAAASLFAFLESLGAKPQVVHIPAAEGKKVGLDDYLAAGNSAGTLESLAVSEPPSFSLTDDDSGESGGKPSYEATEDGLVRIRETKDGVQRKSIANFTATILAETVYFDGQGYVRELDVEAVVNGQQRTITIPADEFERMTWIIPALGSDAIAMPGPYARDEIRAAIQLLSPEIRKFRGVKKLGWTRHRGEYVYVHAGGMIRAETDCEADSTLANRLRFRRPCKLS